MKIFWTKTAEKHLDSIYNFISLTSPQYAIQMVDRITKRSKQLSDFPFSGRKVPEYRTHQIRELIEAPYRIIYYVEPNQIDILAVIHSHRQITEYS